MTAPTDPNGPAGPQAPDVLALRDIDPAALRGLLARFGLELATLEAGAAIPGSFWGDQEAGLVGNRLLARPDTPVHSILHEACHYICMDPGRRRALDTDAGGDYAEENAVCYLQILLAGQLPGMGRERMLTDMDTWGYSFRLGSAARWFQSDADDARAWLIEHGIMDPEGRPSWSLRTRA